MNSLIILLILNHALCNDINSNEANVINPTTDGYYLDALHEVGFGNG